MSASGEVEICDEQPSSGVCVSKVGRTKFLLLLPTGDATCGEYLAVGPGPG